MRASAIWALGGAIAWALFGACADGGQGSAGSSGGGGGGILIGSGGASTCPARCSSDLHDVLDCQGHHLETCPPETACGKSGECIAPCAAAEQAHATAGCEFYSVPPEAELAAPGSCFAVFVANTWTTPITIGAERGGVAIGADSIRAIVGNGEDIAYEPLADGKLGPGELAVVFLSSGPKTTPLHVDCPAPAGIGIDPAIADTGRGTAFRITTSAPAAAYDVYPYGGAKSYIASATLLVPTAAWGKNYVAVDPFPRTPGDDLTGAKPAVQIVAAEDATQVTINPVTGITGGTDVDGTGKHTPVTYELSRGEVLQIAEDDELAGSPIQSSKPIGVWGTIGDLRVPLDNSDTDSAHQQLLPVSALGHVYVAAHSRDRVAGKPEDGPWTLVGAVDGTTLTYDRKPSGAPETLAQGQVVHFNASDPFTMQSQDDDHPFFASEHMTGCQTACDSDAGAPEWVSTVPPPQWLERYLFSTDPTYGNTNLVFLRQKNAHGLFDDVTLDCVGPLGDWAPIGTSGLYEVTRVDLVVGGAAQGQCQNGVHTATSPTAFGLTVWGWDDKVSYAYPAGMGTKPINAVAVPVAPK